MSLSLMELYPFRYKKFLQCKDLSSKTEEDMNCIFGRKKPRRDRKQETPPLDPGSIGNDFSNGSVEQPLISHGIPTITRKLSVHDYFSAKRLEIANKKKEPLVETISPVVAGTCADDEPKEVDRDAKRKRRRSKHGDTCTT